MVQNDPETVDVLVSAEDDEYSSKPETDILIDSVGLPTVDPEKDKQQEDIDQPDLSVPDGGYGWVIVFALFLFNFSTWGANAAYAIFLAHYLNNDTFHGVTKIEYGAIGGLTFGSGLLLSPFLNYAVGRFGIHLVIACGSIIQFAGLMMASWSTRIWELFMTQGVLLGVGMSVVAVPNVVLMPQWFRKRRSLALGLTASGSGLGGVCFSLGLQHIIEINSYQWALRAEAIICVAAQVIALSLTRTRSRHLKTEFKLVDKKTLNFGFFIEIIWVMCTILGYVVLLYNLADFTRSLGYTSNQSSIVSTMVSVGGFFFRPVVGRICDRYGLITSSMIIHLIVAILSWAMWIPARNLATAIAFALLQGGLMGTIWVVAATISTRIVGLRKLNVCMSTVWIFIGIAGIVSPVIGIVLKLALPVGESSDPKQYLHPAIFVGCAYFAASLCLFILRGWVIARDELLQQKYIEEYSQEDTGEELLLTVPISHGFKSCFKRKTIKKV